jgi:hypothetical protein
MGTWDGKVGDIKPALTDWLTQRGGAVSDLPLSLINRAIQRLWAYRPWEFLIKTAPMNITVDFLYTCATEEPGTWEHGGTIYGPDDTGVVLLV